ncbi:hypothetical protein OXA89_00315 [Legionella pneumophila]|nr:hypothetical protein [Legionella pneumophila]MCW8435358.1 hypothetical protein [Legionella pneumophila]WAI64554.1 hypothetical protein OXA89_00315 [Legionella pneumophila]WAI67541.1 hypothetical protein OXA87_00315 [Legionella pneumophila]
MKAFNVPKSMETLFSKAQAYVQDYFQNLKIDPSKGTIDINGERYILVRAASMSIEFFETVKKLYENDASKSEEVVF